MPRLNLLSILTVVLALVVALPLLGLLVQAWRVDDQGVWQHLVDTVLTDYLRNSLLLALGVGVGTLLLGTGSAWLVTRYRFVGQQTLQWALLLPLAMPTYVIAYVYTDALQFAGPVQSTLRELFGWQRGDYWFFEIRSLPGLVLIFSLVLYPYVYVLMRDAFLDRPASTEEVARSLGLSRVQTWWRVILPMARPALVAGLALALMEAFAEFGAVSYFGVNTLTTGIYKAWYSFASPTVAAQLALGLVGLMLLTMWLEKSARGRARYHALSSRRVAPQPLRGWRAVWVMSLCALPILAGFVLPAVWLVRLALADAAAWLDARYWAFAWNSVWLAASAALLALGAALSLGYATRMRQSAWLHALKRFALMGYAVPGTVLAVGLLIPLTSFDHALIAWGREVWGAQWTLWLTGTVFALLFAYLVRFLTVASHAVDSSFVRIRPSLDDAARGMGLSRGQVLWRVHLPLLRGGMLSALLLVFVEVMKELPATIVLRPFNLDTLATQVFVLAADERLAEAAVPSLMIVLVGLLPVILLTRAMRRLI